MTYVFIKSIFLYYPGALGYSKKHNPASFCVTLHLANNLQRQSGIPAKHLPKMLLNCTTAHLCTISLYSGGQGDTDGLLRTVERFTANKEEKHPPAHRHTEIERLSKTC